LRKKFRAEKKNIEKVEQAKKEVKNFALPLAKPEKSDKVYLLRKERINLF